MKFMHKLSKHTYIIYTEKIHDIQKEEKCKGWCMCKCLVFWMKKTKAWPKKSHFLKLSFSLVIFSDKNHRAKFAVTWTWLTNKLFNHIQVNIHFLALATQWPVETRFILFLNIFCYAKGFKSDEYHEVCIWKIILWETNNLYTCCSMGGHISPRENNRCTPLSYNSLLKSQKNLKMNIEKAVTQRCSVKKVFS